jgi:hypothetical protein
MPRGQHLLYCDALVQTTYLHNVLIATAAAAAAAESESA